MKTVLSAVVAAVVGFAAAYAFVSSQSEARLESVLLARIVFEVILRSIDPARFQGSASSSAPLPLNARDFKTHIRRPLRIGAIRMTGDFIHDLRHHVQLPLRIIEIGSVLISLGILAALRRGQVIFRRREGLMLVVQHIGQEPVLKAVVGAAEFSNRVAGELSG